MPHGNRHEFGGLAANVHDAEHAGVANIRRLTVPSQQTP
jgi:hypothetical protein